MINGAETVMGGGDSLPSNSSLILVVDLLGTITCPANIV